ncbi:MAG: NAD-dependent epimerase/dehydratase family protein [Chlamydiae bacterium]|nr:NAD-dependent epimerase/dehydratase family protein [Chlamydiota bacterium]
MKILITGGSGFLGINLVRHLFQKGFHDLVILDIADFQYPEKDRVTFLKGDIRDKACVQKAMEGCQSVIHTAAALPLYSEKDIFSTDVEGTQNLLLEAYRRKIERFVHISSTAVYGIPDHHPVFESDSLQGVGAYGKAKVMAEEACLEYRKKRMCVPIIRPKSFVGPERLGVFALFYNWTKDGKNFPLLGNGKNRYQLLDVEDLCEAIYLVLTKNKEGVNDTFNIGAKIFGTMKDDYQGVLDVAGFGKVIKTFPAAPVIGVLRILDSLKWSPLYKWVYETAAKDSFVSIEKAEKILGFRPRYSNRDALIRNYEWYLEHHQTFDHQSGISHRLPWKQRILRVFKVFF